MASSLPCIFVKRAGITAKTVRTHADGVYAPSSQTIEIDVFVEEVLKCLN